ncbi:MAG: murein biosynthesis integral membrane protein MurJ [Chitinophagaceae bacterium]|nr:murein biosynthesis integral membrane protein MurJ [Oligoflexus sp.]
MNKPDSSKENRSLASLAVAAGILLSRLAGLIRTRFFAAYLGNSEAAGAYSAAMKIPNFLQNLFGEGIMSASFIPVYARLRAEGRNEEAVEVAETIGSILGIVVTVFAGIGVLSSRVLIDILAPGFVGETRELTIHIVQILFPGAALLVLSAWCLAVLNSHKQFLLAYAAPVVWNISIIVALIVFGQGWFVPIPNQMDLALQITWGTLVGCLLQFLVQLPKAMRLSQFLRFRISIRSPEVRTVIRNFFPVVLSRGVIQISAWIDASIASLLSAPMVAALGYAQQLYLLPISLFAMSISAAQLPAMSSIVGTSDEIHSVLRDQLATSLKRVTFFVIPSVVAFLVLGDVVTATVLMTGRFQAKDVIIVWTILAGSTFGLLAQTQGRLFSSTFYALKDSRTPVKFAIIRVSITGVLGYIFAVQLRNYWGWSEVIGTAALTATAGFGGWVEYILLRRSLVLKIGPVLVPRSFLAKLWTMALAASGIAYGLKLLLPAIHPLVNGPIVLGVYGLIYMGETALFDVGEGRGLIKKVLRKLKLSK